MELTTPRGENQTHCRRRLCIFPARDRQDSGKAPTLNAWTSTLTPSEGVETNLAQDRNSSGYVARPRPGCRGARPHALPSVIKHSEPHAALTSCMTPSQSSGAEKCLSLYLGKQLLVRQRPHLSRRAHASDRSRRKPPSRPTSREPPVSDSARRLSESHEESSACSDSRRQYP